MVCPLMSLSILDPNALLICCAIRGHPNRGFNLNEKGLKADLQPLPIGTASDYISHLLLIN